MQQQINADLDILVKQLSTLKDDFEKAILPERLLSK